MYNIKEYFEEWRKDEERKLKRKTIGSEDTKAKRSYIHFDKRRSGLCINKYKAIFTNRERVARLTFWPFIKIELKEERIKNAPKGCRRKKQIKKRNVYFAAHQDALVYSWYSFLLNKSYDDYLKKLNIDKNVIAYRRIARNDIKNKNKCNIQFAQEIFDYIKKHDSECVVIVSDITGFFDNLDHQHLEYEWKRVLSVPDRDKLPEDHKIIYNNLTKFKYIDSQKIYKAFNVKYKTKKKKIDGITKVFSIPTIDNKQIDSIMTKPFTRKDFVNRVVQKNLIKGNQNWNNVKKCHKGIMQGSPISATLANIYMMSFDEKISKLVKDKKGIFRRYSDDIIVVCKKENYKEILNGVISEVQKYQLEINPSKTDTTFFIKDEKGTLIGRDGNSTSSKLKKMQYLGFEFDGQNIYIRPRSITKYYRKMKSKIRKAVHMAFSKKSKTKNKENIVFKKKLYEKFIRAGKRSFITYALRANDFLGGKTIQKQLSNRNKIMKEYLEKKRRKYIRFPN